MNKKKQCRRCSQVKVIAEFVDDSGTRNSRGRYCGPCHLDRVKECREHARSEEQAKLPKLQIIYGKYWKHYALPHDFSFTLRDERDFCPYCGDPLPSLYANGSNPSDPFRGRPHIDHMDPLSSGGEDSIRNVVYICDKCNYKKGDVLFLDWLTGLKPPYQKLARQIYRQKHGHLAEKFKTGDSVPRTNGLSAELYLDERELREMYPKPIVDCPPSNEQTIIALSLGDLVKNSEIEELLKGRTKRKRTCG